MVVMAPPGLLVPVEWQQQQQQQRQQGQVFVSRLVVLKSKVS
jgi:hypothetical protein